jgi:hypothetical protein
MVSVDQIRASYRTLMDQVGEDIVIRRYTGTGTNRPKIDVHCQARVVGYAPSELTGVIQQGDRFIIVLADDVVMPTTDSPPQSLSLPLLSSDKVVVRGKELQIISADDSSRRVQGVLVAIEIQARG